MAPIPQITEGQILTGPQFAEPMRVETVRESGATSWVLGLVGTKSDRFRKVTLSAVELAALRILESGATYDGDPSRLRLALQAYSLGIAYEYDPYFGLSISRVDPLPHQLEAVYDYLLKSPSVRFLLADDAGAGKTIMAGLLIRELKLRGLAERILVVAPANLAFQWQREMREKFDEKFILMRGSDIREQFGVNQWIEQRQIVTSLDLAKRMDVLPGLRQVRWDLVVVDEAHRLSWSPPARKTARYALGELLRDSADHFLLLTATPHKGDPGNFSLFLQLLDRDVYADVVSIEQAMERRQAPFYLRRTKEAMIYFPRQQDDGSWVAEKIFKKRIPKTIDFAIDGAEFDLYRDATRFVKQQSARAAAKGEDQRARAVAFLMALYQRRLASSTRALRRSLESRARRLTEALKRAHELLQTAPADLPDWDELEEMEESERERVEEWLAAVSITNNAEEVRDEVAQLNDLARVAVAVEESGSEAKLSRLKKLLHDEGFFDAPEKRLLIFTEFKDTLDYLVEMLRAWGFGVTFIHGGMKPGSREEPGSRLYAEQQFKEAAAQILVATEAAGEGINLQFCNVLFNYDIPWNPNRLEQRMGRIHRYGQKKDCLIFNFVATNTIEGRVLQRLLEKLQEIRNALDDDAVFNVVGEVLPAAHVERILRDYYAGKLGAEDLEERMLQNVDEGRFRAICQNALEGLASKKLNLEMLVERRAKAQERRVVPETIARFISEAAERAGLTLKEVPAHPHTFDPGRTPHALRSFDQDPDWKLPAVVSRYPRLSTDRETAETEVLEWVTPGHPLFEALRRHALQAGSEHLKKGGCFWSLQHDHPARIDVYRARVVDGMSRVIHERLFAVELASNSEPHLRETTVFNDLLPATKPDVLPEVSKLPEATSWLHDNCLRPFLEEVRRERVAEVDRVEQHLTLSLTELLQRADDEIGRAAAERDEGVQGAEGRLAQAEARHADLMHRRETRMTELGKQRSLTLQDVERLVTIVITPHPERDAPDVMTLRTDPETEAAAMRYVIEYERVQGRHVEDVHEKNLGYDITSIDLVSGDLRLIEVKGIGASSGIVPLTPNEKRVAEDRRDCYWLYVVTEAKTNPTVHRFADPSRLPWHEVVKVDHYYVSLNRIRDRVVVKDAPSSGGAAE
jgi:superfamily II DNA or RNA helicase